MLNGFQLFVGVGQLLILISIAVLISLKYVPVHLDMVDILKQPLPGFALHAFLCHVLQWEMLTQFHVAVQLHCLVGTEYYRTKLANDFQVSSVITLIIHEGATCFSQSSNKIK